MAQTQTHTEQGVTQEQMLDLGRQLTDLNRRLQAEEERSLATAGTMNSLRATVDAIERETVERHADVHKGIHEAVTELSERLNRATAAGSESRDSLLVTVAQLVEDVAKLRAKQGPDPDPYMDRITEDWLAANDQEEWVIRYTLTQHIEGTYTQAVYYRGNRVPIRGNHIGFMHDRDGRRTSNAPDGMPVSTTGWATTTAMIFELARAAGLVPEWAGQTKDMTRPWAD